METLEIKDRNATCIKIPDTVTNIDYGKAFLCCDELECIECDSDYFKSIDGVLFTADYKTLVCYPLKKNDISYIVPESVTHIGHSAFSNCKSLERVILPSSLISIGQRSFFQCFYLQNIELSDSLTEIGEEAFSFCKSLREINLPNSVLEIGSCVFENCSSLRQVILSASLSCIPEYAFHQCEKLKKITLPDSVKHIGEKAFYCCKSLREVKLTENIISVDSYAFGSCRSLEKIELSNSIKNIEECLFYGCESLQEIELPENIENIYSGAFGGCKSLEKIKLPNSIQYIGDEVFPICESLETIECDNEQYQTIDGVLFDRKEKRCLCYPQGKIGRKYVIPDGTLIIGKSAFYNCRELEEITLPNSVRAIESKAFRSCSGLKSIKLPNQVDLIEPSVFDGCWSLNIECDNPFFKSIDGVLFTADCKALVCYPEGKGCENYVIPDSVSNIAEGAFHSFSDSFGSTSCKSITLPKSLAKITSVAFKDHESLKRIECDSNYYKSIDGVLFTADFKTLVCYPRGRKGSQYIIPDSVVNVEEDAFECCYSLDEILVPNGSLGEFKRMISEEIWEKLKEK